MESHRLHLGYREELVPLLTPGGLVILKENIGCLLVVTVHESGHLEMLDNQFWCHYIQCLVSQVAQSL
jgi:hypothetical protein